MPPLMEIKKYLKNIPLKASQLLSVLLRLPKLRKVKVQTSAILKVSLSHVPDTELLGYLLAVSGSDKSVRHDYHLIYGPFLSSIKDQPGPMVEIGLGTQNKEFPSHMDPQYKPLGGARAFRDFLPNAHVLGADIDRELLVSEERLSCYYVDQLEPSTFGEIQSAILQHGGALNFAVVDGLHRPLAVGESVKESVAPRTIVPPETME